MKKPAILVTLSLMLLMPSVAAQSDAETVELTLDRDDAVYNRGDDVLFEGSFGQGGDGMMYTITVERVVDGSPVYTDQAIADEGGSFSGRFTVSNDADEGQYEMTVAWQDDDAPSETVAFEVTASQSGKRGGGGGGSSSARQGGDPANEAGEDDPSEPGLEATDEATPDVDGSMPADGSNPAGAGATGTDGAMALDDAERTPTGSGGMLGPIVSVVVVSGLGLLAYRRLR